MNADARVQEYLQAAHGLGAVLAAAYDAFEYILTAIRTYQDRAEDMFAAFAMSAASAADGRDAVAFAPSFPPLVPRGTAAPAKASSAGRDAGEAADGLAAVSQLLAARLSAAAGWAQDPGDTAACAQAAGHAQSISVLLSGAGP